MMILRVVEYDHWYIITIYLYILDNVRIGGIRIEYKYSMYIIYKVCYGWILVLFDCICLWTHFIEEGV